MIPTTTVSTIGLRTIIAGATVRCVVKMVPAQRVKCGVTMGSVDVGACVIRGHDNDVTHWSMI